MTIEDIKLIKNSERKTSACVEFYIGDWEKARSHWNDESIFLDDIIYNYVFADSFKKSNPKFNYFGTTHYTRDYLVVLTKFLNQNLQKLSSVKTYDDFIKLAEFYSSAPPETSFRDAFRIFFGIYWQKDWQQAVDQLKRINIGLVAFAQECLNTNKDLWVLGV